MASKPLILFAGTGGAPQDSWDTYQEANIRWSLPSGTGDGPRVSSARFEKSDDERGGKMIRTGTILLMTLSVLGTWQNDRNKESAYSVTLEETACAPTRRIRCTYDFVEVAAGQNRKGKPHFSLLFYMGADRAEGKDDAISRLDRFFRIKRTNPLTPGVGSTDTVGYKQAVTLRRRGSRYEFSREDGEKIVVDIEKKTRP